MSDSTSLLDLIAQSQASKEVTANALFNAAARRRCLAAATRCAPVSTGSTTAARCWYPDANRDRQQHMLRWC